MDDALLAQAITTPETLTIADLEALDAALAADAQLRRRLADHRWLDERCSRLLHPHRADFSARVHSALEDAATGPRFMRRVRSAIRPGWVRQSRWLLPLAAALVVGVALGWAQLGGAPAVANPIAPPAVTWRSPDGTLSRDALHQVQADTSLHLDDGHGSLIQVDGPAQLHLAADGALALTGGQLRAELVPGAPRHFRTGPLAVEVLGTIFAIGTGEAGAWLLVERGAVACREDGGAPQRIAVGQAWVTGIGPLTRLQNLFDGAGEDLRWSGSRFPTAPVRHRCDRVLGAAGLSLISADVPPGNIPWLSCSLLAAQDWRAGEGIGLWHRGDLWQVELVEGLPGEPLDGNLHQERFVSGLSASTTWRWTFLPWSAFARRDYQEPEPQIDGLTRGHMIAVSFLAAGTGGANRLDVQDLTVLGRRAAP